MNFIANEYGAKSFPKSKQLIVYRERIFRIAGLAYPLVEFFIATFDRNNSTPYSEFSTSTSKSKSRMHAEHTDVLAHNLGQVRSSATWRVTASLRALSQLIIRTY
jgi:hypothetical protein